jgi:carbonic anhydrase
MRTLTKKCQSDITPLMAVDLLKKGNERFIRNLKINRNLLEQVNETSDAQHPFAVIISCMDSRTSAELIFDQGLGDIFSIRIAGNIITDEIIGSAEFGCKVIGAKTIVVLGHTGCGAIKGAINNVELGKLHSITSKIQRCLAPLRKEGITEGDLCQQLTMANAQQGMSDLLSGSDILSGMVANGEISIISGIYDVTTGVVEFTYDIQG